MVDLISLPPNATKYEACIMGLQAALGLRVKEFEVYGDLALIISQIQNKWKIKEERLMPYQQCLQKWALKCTLELANPLTKCTLLVFG